VKAEQRDHVDKFIEEIKDELPPELDLGVEGAVERIMGISRRLSRMMEETLSERGISWGEFKLLGVLVHRGAPYRMSPGKLAEHLELSSGAMTNRLDRLEEAGYIERRPDPDDRRGVQVVLTPAGQRLYKQSTAVQGKKESLIATALSERERDELNALLRRVMITFEEQEEKR
jgi:DNA-binding MarR family transcriptional regulator